MSSSDSGPTQTNRVVDSAGEVSWDDDRSINRPIGSAAARNQHETASFVALPPEFTQAIAESQGAFMANIKDILSVFAKDIDARLSSVRAPSIPDPVNRQPRVSAPDDSQFVDSPAPRVQRVTIRPAASRKPPPHSKSSDSDPTSDDSNEDEGGPQCAGPDGLRYPLHHGLEYLVDLPELAFGHRFSWVARSVQRLGAIFATMLEHSNQDTIQSLCDGVEITVSMAAMAQQLADQPTMADEEVEYFNRLLDSRRARLPIAKAMPRLSRATKTALGDGRRTSKSTSNTDNFRGKRTTTSTPSTPCPNCRQFGHWKRDCPLLPRLPVLPPNAPSAPADLHH